ncbi:MAG: hypothetical protein Kow00109_21900 [Acidobacteriota bacterium]
MRRQTFVWDVGELREEAVPDAHGNVLPPEVEAGQAHWSVLGADAHAMVGRVEFVAAAAEQFWNDWGSGQSPPARMVINDMSLPWGGLFDLNCRWNDADGNQSHREGRNVDIPFRIWTGTDNWGSQAGTAIPLRAKPGIPMVQNR